MNGVRYMRARMTDQATEIIALLGLRPHPEGGYYAETFRSSLEVASVAHAGARQASTAIYFLLRTRDFSAFHRVRSDEVWHHYAGDALELVVVCEASSACSRVRLGSALQLGERPQYVVPANVWQAARPLAGPHGYALVGCTVAPGFEFADFELPARSELLARMPVHAALIGELTR